MSRQGMAHSPHALCEPSMAGVFSSILPVVLFISFFDQIGKDPVVAARNLVVSGTRGCLSWRQGKSGATFPLTASV